MANRKPTKATGRKGLDKLKSSQVLSGASSRKTSGSRWKQDPTPPAHHLFWFRQHYCLHRSLRSIAAEAGVHHNAVWEAVQKVDEWARIEQWDEALKIKARQTQTIEHLIAEAIEGWEKSKEIAVTEEFESITVQGANGEDRPAERKKRNEVHQCGSVSFIHAALDGMRMLQKLYGLDRQRIVQDDDGEGWIDMDGMDHDEAIIAQAKAILARLEPSDAAASVD